MSVQNRVALVTPLRMTADGIVFSGTAMVSGITIIDRGTGGSLTVYEGIDTNGLLRYPATAYTSLTNGSVIQFSRSLSHFASMYVTLPTGGAIVLVHIAPR
jgi:hypothetical protein